MGRLCHQRRLVLFRPGCLCQLLAQGKFVGTPVEGGLAVLTCGFWAAVLPALMDPDNGLAASGELIEFGNPEMDRDNELPTSGLFVGLSNPNLYFFSWGAFVMSFYVLFGYLKKGVKLSGSQIFSWAGLAMTSFVVMVSGSVNLTT